VPLLDVVLGYDCNLKCSYCTITDAMRRRSLPTEAIAREIDAASRRGFRDIAFTGGEPTIFPDLPKLVRFARTRGYEDVKVASNGLRYAHLPFLDHLLDAGVTTFHMSMHAFDDAAYERTVARADTAKLRRTAIENLVSRGHPPVADLIVKNDTIATLGPWIASLVALGINRVNLWLVSLTDNNANNVEQLPKITDVVPELVRAFDDADRGGYDVFSLHVPRCFLPGHEAHVRHPGADGVRVVTPDDVFDLSESRLTGGVKPAEMCGACKYRDACPGLRRDYVDRFGTGELRAVI
jgi:cyclic pyranopterin phosphate synthase